MKRQVTLKKIIAGVIILFCVFTQLHSQPTTLQWAKSVGGTNSDLGYTVTTDAAGNVYTIGLFNGTADFDPGPATLNFNSAGGEDVFLTKLDAAGNFVWAKQIGGILSDDGIAIAIDASGTIYTAGLFGDTVDFDPGPGVTNLISAGGTDIFVCKLDSSGNFVWAKNMGGASADYALALALDSSDNIYTTGVFQGLADFDPGAAAFNITSICSAGDMFISKLDSAGNFLWAKDIGGTQAGRSTSITLDASDNVYTTGYYRGTTDFDPGPGTNNLFSVGAQDIFILKLDAAGNFVWAKSMGEISFDIGYALTADAFGNIYTTGSFQSTVDFDPGPGVNNLTSAGAFDIFILKLDTAGNFIWAKEMGGPSTDNTQSITTDISGNIYATGTFFGTADFDPGPAVVSLTSAGSFDAYILKLDSSGNYMGVQQMGGPGSDQGISISVDSIGNIYTIGDYSVTADFDPSPATFNLTSQGISDVFIMKMSQGVFTETHENVFQNNINIFPNPSTGKVNLVFDQPLSNATLLLINTTGQTVMEKSTISGSQFALDLSDVANGIYFIEVNDKGIRTQMKVVKD